VLKVLLFVICDNCHNLFPYSRLTEGKPKYWAMDAQPLEDMAKDQGWISAVNTKQGTFHYCQTCEKKERDFHSYLQVAYLQ
jgi:hypothetical protein